MARGRLRVYLGAAPGVGKTYAMLNEGRRRRGRGTDVVVGYVETHGRPRTAEQIADLEVVPRRALTYRDATLEEMDLDAVLARAPEVALVDELAHTNAPGSRNAKRWQDVEELLDAGINVISTVNIQHLESLNDVVEAITGIRQHETIPDEVVRAAEQIELVDMTAEAIRQRLAHGNIYRPDKIDAALANYFRPGNLGALRELALLWVADRVDENLQAYREAHGIERPWETRERVVVAVTGALSGEGLIRRAARMAQRTRGDLLGLHVRSADGRREAPTERLGAHRRLLEDLGGTYHEIVAVDVAGALVDFARTENATQLVLGSSQRSRIAEMTRGSVINGVIRRSGPIDVHVISPPLEAAGSDLPAHRKRRRATLSARRRVAGWAVALVGIALLTPLLASGRDAFDQGAQFLFYTALVLAAAAVGGIGPAAAAAIGGFAALNWYFTEPLYTWTIGSAADVVALVLFVALGVAVGVLVNAFARRSAEANRSRAEAEALARIAGGLVGAEDPVPSALERMRTTLDLDGIALVDRSGTIVAVSGVEPQPSEPATTVMGLEGGELRVAGWLRPDDQRLITAFADHLTVALEQRHLRTAAAEAAALSEADALRTALLRAVSHDLRSPLAAIKATVTGLLQPDVDWSAEQTKEQLLAVDEETDRLDRLVANLLDASRLEAGVIRPDLQATAVDDVITSAVRSLSGVVNAVEVEVEPTLPLALADPALLERALANIIANAARVSPPGARVRVVATEEAGVVEIRVSDQGPGVAPALRPVMFEPFQQLGDTGNGAGLGLGLAVAKGLVEAMAGQLAVRDNPDGGLTLVLRLPIEDAGR